MPSHTTQERARRRSFRKRANPTVKIKIIIKKRKGKNKMIPTITV